MGEPLSIVVSRGKKPLIATWDRWGAYDEGSVKYNMKNFFHAVKGFRMTEDAEADKERLCKIIKDNLSIGILTDEETISDYEGYCSWIENVELEDLEKLTNKKISARLKVIVEDYRGDN